MSAKAEPRVDDRPRHDTKVFVGSFPEGTDMEAVQAHLGAAGAITNFTVKDKKIMGQEVGEETKVVKNAFITFESAEGATACLDQFNGKTFTDGTEMRVEFKINKKKSKPKKEAAPAAAAGAADSVGAATSADRKLPGDPNKIIIKDLAKGTTEEQVRTAAEASGTIQSVKMIKRGKPRAFVAFSSPDEATAAMAAINGSEINGKAVVSEMDAPLAPRARAPKAPKAPKAAKQPPAPKQKKGLRDDPTATFVGDLLESVDREAILAGVPGVSRVKFIKKRKPREGEEVQTTSSAILSFESEEAAAAAVGKNGGELFAGSGTVRVEKALPRGGRKAVQAAEAAEAPAE